MLSAKKLGVLTPPSSPSQQESETGLPSPPPPSPCHKKSEIGSAPLPFLSEILICCTQTYKVSLLDP